MQNNEKTLKEILAQFVNSRPIKQRYTQVSIEEVWGKTLGPTISQYTREIRFRNGMLTVRIDSAPLRQELTYGREKVRNLLNEALGQEVVKGVRIY